MGAAKAPQIEGSQGSRDGLKLTEVGGIEKNQINRVLLTMQEAWVSSPKVEERTKNTEVYHVEVLLCHTEASLKCLWMLHRGRVAYRFLMIRLYYSTVVLVCAPPLQPLTVPRSHTEFMQGSDLTIQCSEGSQGIHTSNYKLETLKVYWFHWDQVCTFSDHRFFGQGADTGRLLVHMHVEARSQLQVTVLGSRPP